MFRWRFFYYYMQLWGQISLQYPQILHNIISKPNFSEYVSILTFIRYSIRRKPATVSSVPSVVIVFETKIPSKLYKIVANINKKWKLKFTHEYSYTHNLPAKVLYKYNETKRENRRCSGISSVSHCLRNYTIERFHLAAGAASLRLQELNLPQSFLTELNVSAMPSNEIPVRLRLAN